MTRQLLKERSAIQTVKPLIPQSAYRPVKRCPNCSSVYLTDDTCEACGRNLFYHPIGEPFGPQSLYGLKERFYHSLPYAVRLFPLFENRKNSKAQSYLRHLNRRFQNLLDALAGDSLNSPVNRRLFYVEIMELMDELIRYGEPFSHIQQKIEEEFGFKNMLMTSELISYLQDSALNTRSNQHWVEILLGYRIWGFLKLENAFKFLLISAAAITAAITFYEIIRSQFGK